eukprot:CAMPEP_0118956280 /NCGR_PEP_ID=MMETSP1169-20130426/61453_1 /TAXON_ID=36882 /ORGANISM="Pyramimonas obovata, Strain CCMP722" /LENGTH=205 /DNA_ID=CAMNT_0006904295 /DNA_START=40 /DNA_END=654 /DNA_ORIENTATION=-
MPRSYYEEVLDMDFPVWTPGALSIEGHLFVGSVVLCFSLSVISRYRTLKQNKELEDGTAENNKSRQKGGVPLAASKAELSAQPVSYDTLKLRYLSVYLPGVFGDWIQGAYLYALYRAYHLGMAEIGYLFVMGYGMSALLGTYVASMGDRYGHRFCVTMYGVLYSLSCVTMHSSSFEVLMIGRVFGGIAYSLLYSSFEAWAVAEVT